MHEIKKITLTETQKAAIKKLLGIKYPSLRTEESNTTDSTEDAKEDNK
jgi:hypothetical protein